MTTTPHIRARWAAIGAALAVSIGAGGVGVGHAVLDSGERATLVAITPCRLLDTRPDSSVGGRATPVGAGESIVVDGHGASGQCTLSEQASALALNVTTVGASEPTFLTIYPDGEAVPSASQVNAVPGQPPTPNEVPTKLGASGGFAVFNKFGSVHVVIDVVGYYEDHNHDDRYYTKAQSDQALATKASSADVYTKPQVDAELATKADAADLDDVYTIDETDVAIAGAIEAAAQSPIRPLSSDYVGPDPSSFSAELLVNAGTVAVFQPGTLMLSRTAEVSINCLSGTPVGYLIAPTGVIANSVQRVSAEPRSQTFSGLVTVPSGPTTFFLGLDCVGGNSQQSGINAYGALTAVLFPDEI